MKKREKDILVIAMEYAIEKHTAINQRYGDYPYDYHLRSVYQVALRFIHLIPKQHRDAVLAACWLHDIIEDAHQSYNDVLNKTNLEVAEIAYALTNEKGRTRADRANDAYYLGIRETRFASFVKLCDRIANFEFSIETKSRMTKMYAKENPNFISKVYVPGTEELVEFLNNLVDENTTK